jgi:hypothetical protein
MKSRKFKGFKSIETETGAKDNEYRRAKGKGRYLDKDYYILTENIKQVRQKLRKVRPNEYHLRQAEEKLNIFLKEATICHNCLGCDFKISSIDFTHLIVSDLIVPFSGLR